MEVHGPNLHEHPQAGGEPEAPHHADGSEGLPAEAERREARVGSSLAGVKRLVMKEQPASQDPWRLTKGRLEDPLSASRTLGKRVSHQSVFLQLVDWSPVV